MIQEYRSKINIIPQFELNSYLDCLPTSSLPNIIENINDIENRCNWKQGDFLIHFAGLNYNLQKEQKIDIDILIKKFVSLYKIYIIRKEGIDYGSIK